MAENACRPSTEVLLREMMECGYFLRLDAHNMDDLEPGMLRWSLFRTKPTDLYGRVHVFVYSIENYPKMVEAAYDAFNEDTTIPE